MTADTQLFLLLNSIAGQSPLLDSVLVFLASDLAYVLIAVFFVFVILSHYSKRQKWELLLVAGVSSVVARFGIAELIRFFYHRPRPFVDLPAHQLLTSTEWSFPSGHATFFFALSTAVYLYNKKWGIGLFVATVLMTVSRVAAGIHYPSDIIAGAAVGAGIAYAVFSLARRFLSTSSPLGSTGVK